MTTARSAPYLPFLSGPAEVAPRLSPIAEDGWLRPDTEADIWLGPKRDLMRRARGGVFASVKGSEGAIEAVCLALLRHRGETSETPDDAAVWPTPLEAVAARVSDDLCVMVPDHVGQWRLVAASVCAPTFWSLAEVIGQPLGAIHGPVPGGDPALAGRISRVFDGLAEGPVLERFNWTVQAGGARFTPTSAPLKALAAQARVADAADLLHLRVERQTVRKVCPPEGPPVVLFTIRVAVDPLAPILEEPALRTAFRAAWNGTKAGLADYKGWPALDRLVQSVLA